MTQNALVTPADRPAPQARRPWLRRLFGFNEAGTTTRPSFAGSAAAHNTTGRTVGSCSISQALAGTRCATNKS